VRWTSSCAQGKVRYVGHSNLDAAQVEEVERSVASTALRSL
jgi:hypothetical protein